MVFQLRVNSREASQVKVIRWILYFLDFSTITSSSNPSKSECSGCSWELERDFQSKLINWQRKTEIYYDDLTRRRARRRLVVCRSSSCSDRGGKGN